MDETPNGRTQEGDAQDPFEILGQFLDQDGWYPQQLEDRAVYRVFFNGKNGELRCYAQIHHSLEHLLFYAVAPVKAPVECRPAVAEFITRANYGMRIGNFEMDYSDGEIRYKSSVDFEGETLTHNWIRNAIYPAVQTMDRYLNGLMAVIYGGKTPADAVADVEGDGG
jgi:hypothetical protein